MRSYLKLWERVRGHQSSSIFSHQLDYGYRLLEAMKVKCQLDNAWTCLFKSGCISNMLRWRLEGASHMPSHMNSWLDILRMLDIRFNNDLIRLLNDDLKGINCSRM